MKRPKDRFYRVMVIGATPAGIAAADKLGQLGIPVTLVDNDTNLDKKLSADEWRLKSGIRMNHAHRPGLIRLIRNPLVTTLFPGRVNSIGHSPLGFEVKLTRRQTFVDPDRCVLCGRCEEICPVSLTENGKSWEKAIRFDGRASLPGCPVIDKRRAPLCRENCPLGVNAQGYIALARKGKYADALDLIRERNILPGVCGRVCIHPCETDCRRGSVDNAVSVRAIKRFLSDWGADHPDNVISTQKPAERKEKFAVIGSGPAGIAAAAEIASCGCPVTVFDKEKMAGGLLRYGIGPHRLPRRILDAELLYIKNLGVKFALGKRLPLAADLPRMRDEYDGIIIATGSWKDRPLGVKGEDLDGVEGCLSFLGRFHRGEISRQYGKVAVIGDGNAAFDLARTLTRTGAEVTIVSWFAEDAIPADPDEVKGAVEEGVSIIDRSQVVCFQGKNGRFERLLCKPTRPGPKDSNGIAWPVVVENCEPYPLVFDRAFIAIGQAGALAPADGPVINDYGFIKTDANLRTSFKNVYAAGDAVSGPSTVVHAMAKGRAAAKSALREICGIGIDQTGPQRPADRDFRDIPMDTPVQGRALMPQKQGKDRTASFSEVALGLSEDQVVYEAGRCLQCGVCAECMQCEEACGAIGAIRHDQPEEESTEHAAVVIIADPLQAPTVHGNDVIRTYGRKSAKPDVYAMMMRGFAAAAQAMILLGNGSNPGKKYELSMPLPEPPLADDVRIGVVVCRCNNSLGWLGEMDRFVGELKHEKDIYHTEIVTSACLPEQVAEIVAAVRARSLTRLVMGSCVCCSLDFVCSACTDQRSRLKHSLFTAMGISRSMVVMFDIRGEALSFLQDDPVQGRSRFERLLMQSLDTARNLKQLPTPVRKYNPAVAVLGQSETAVHGAQALAEMGINVIHLIDSITVPKTARQQSNILCFNGAAVDAISGTLGNFRLDISTGDSSRAVNVGAVIVGDRSVKKIHYAGQQGFQSYSVECAMQKQGAAGVPYLYPGMTPIAGLFVANPPGVRLSSRKKGRAAALLAAVAIMRGPERNRGLTVVVDEEMCRGCGRCAAACPYHAVTFTANGLGFWHASVDPSCCRACGNCISVCPSGAVDSPQQNQEFLTKTLGTILLQESIN